MEIEKLLTLTAARGVGAVRYEKLVQHFGDIDTILKSGQKALERVPGIGPEIASEIRKSADEARGEKELAEAKKQDIKIISYLDESYPENLKTIYDYPLILYVKGEIIPEDRLAIAVVGSRRSTYYGKRQSELLSYDLALRGICVASGLARGIDTHAHMGALKAKGRTIAVLGSGLNNIYPAENKKLAEAISKSGAVISELPLNTPPDSRNFPVRNRIISGLSLGVLVVEAPLKSGALITVNMALDQGRDVFAVPGKIDSISSQGCHYIIKHGAKLVETVEDILEELPLYNGILKADSNKEKTAKQKTLDYKQETIINLLSQDEPKHIDTIIIESKLSPPLVSATLLDMEIKRYVKQLPGKNFIRTV